MLVLGWVLGPVRPARKTFPTFRAMRIVFVSVTLTWPPCPKSPALASEGVRQARNGEAAKYYLELRVGCLLAPRKANR
jgi:hypothetical protein